MSRVGKQPIKIPEGVDVKVEDFNVKVKGPKGELNQQVHRLVNIDQKDNELMVSVKNPEEKLQKSLWGLFQRLIVNMITGVTEGYSKKLEVNGVGYKAAVAGDILNLQLGYSHPIDYKIPEGIKVEVEKNVITVSGIDKQQVGQISAEIRAKRKPEPYKGKGIKYADEVIRRKVGKTASKGAE
ncbi:MAG: 50S ribosomal protein L6 [Parcubacteria group bacterium]|nr:50S ribosomal protein L6 [Parcubacteria group bacterium]